MEVIRLLIIVTMFCQNEIVAKKSQQINRLIFDLTRPVNELISKEISQQDFLSDVHSAFNLIGQTTTTFTIFYATDGSTIEELESRTQDACNILHDTLNISSNSQLLLSWTFHGAANNILHLNISYNQTFYGCSPKLVLHFNDYDECKRVSNHYAEQFDSNNGMLVGISYDESLRRCISVYRWQPHAPIVIVNLKYGTTRGVTESFGLFQRRMDFLSDLVQFGLSNSVFLYYPNPHSVGNFEHQNLLIQYASIWTTSNETRGSILLQVPNSRSKTTEMERFFVLPVIKSGIPHLRNEDVLSSFIWFTASFQRHLMFIVDSDIWKLWDDLPKESIRPPSIRKRASSIDLALDCGWSYCKELPSRLNSDNKTTIVFEVDDVGGLPNLPSEIAKQFNTKLTIGCKYNASFQSLNASNLEHVVRSCQTINGSIYILSTTIQLELINEIGEYSFFFENTIRKELHAVNQFRKGIMEKVPSAKVYFQLSTEENSGSDIKSYPQSNSLFCDEPLLAENLYFEGIYNWAKLENFPIATLIWNQNRTNSFFPEWSTLLRRLNRTYPEWTVKKSRGNQMQSSSISSPGFLMHDYVKSIHNWEPDACIDWTERKWKITDDFLHNPKTGTVFHHNSILKNRSLTEDECIIMLHFICHRFRLVEISVSFNSRNLLAAIEHKMSSRDFSAQIFVNYEMPEHQNNLPEFTSFIDQLKKMFEKGLVNGVHAELVLGSGMNNVKNISNSNNFETVLSMMKYAKLSNITCGIELPSVEMCYKILRKFTLSDVYLELLGIVNYLVIKETFGPLTWEYDALELQNLLDSHLALKRTLDQMIPHLRVYFRVEFDFEIDFKNDKKVDTFTNFLALFKSFGTQYDISYFVGVAFDGQSVPKQNGWWGIKNYSDLTNPQSFVEKVTDLRRQKMWYPPTLSTSPSITASNNEDFSGVIIVISVSSVVVVLLGIAGIFFGFRYKKLQRLTRLLSDSEVQEFLNGRASTNTEPANTEIELMGSVECMKFNEEYRLDLPDLIIDFNKILGSGAFGTVYHGLTKGVPAAIKRPNGDCSKSTFKSVLTEVKVLSYVGKHPNVVGFLGAYVEEIYKGVLYISTELCALGSLESFLRKKKIVTSQTVCNQEQTTELDGSVLYFHDLNIFALEIAKGMQYIESRRVVHGDLSTRNVLLDENLVCKIGDFGLSRKLYEYQKYVKSSQEPLPWKWMAPESLSKMEFTSKTDLWSYGITLWEIYTLGKIPYAGLNWAVDFANDLENGLRLPNPNFASVEIYAKLLECWNFNPDERPSFSDMINFFNSLSEDAYMILNSI